CGHSCPQTRYSVGESMKRALGALSAALLLSAVLFVASPLTGSVLHPQTAGACPGFTLYSENTRYSGQVYDYGQQKNTWVGFDLQIYWDGATCNDFEYREFTWVGDGSTAYLDQWTEAATCIFGVCGSWYSTNCITTATYNGCWGRSMNLCNSPSCQILGDDTSSGNY